MGPGFCRDDNQLLKYFQLFATEIACSSVLCLEGFMDERTYAVYMLASKPYGTLYIGVTGNLITRIAQHREGKVAGFTQKYAVKTLVWFKWYEDVQLAIRREKQMKEWRRDWKIQLVEESNPRWADLYGALLS
jgi:putative endonuclease